MTFQVDLTVKFRQRPARAGLAVLLVLLAALVLAQRPATAQSRSAGPSMVVPVATSSNATRQPQAARRPPVWLRQLPYLKKGCTFAQMRAGKCGRRPGGGEGPASGNSSGGGPRIICINGKRHGHGCACPNGGTARPIGRSTFKCDAPVRPCPDGYTRAGGKCIVPPCPKGTRRSGRACLPIVTPEPQPPSLPCPPGTHRSGRRCIGDARPDPNPPGPRCRKGWYLKGQTCVRLIGTACPSGTRKQNGSCVNAALPVIPPVGAPPAVRPPQPNLGRVATADDAYEPDEVLVEISGTAAQTVANRLIGTFGLVTLSRTQLAMLGTNLYRFRIPQNQSVEAVVATLAREPGVDAVQPNWRYALNADNVAPAIGAPRTPLPQYALDLVEARQAHAISRGAKVLIAIIDTGVDDTHPEIAGAIAGRLNTFPSQPFEADTHATAIAGIIAARGDLSGIAPDAGLLAVQAFTPANARAGGSGTAYRIATGLNWAMMKGARVVNMSFAGPQSDDLLARLIVKGDEGGIVFVAAAGNGGPKAKPAFPASHPAVIAVTAIDDTRALYEHANVGSYIDVAAPGVDIMAPAAGNRYDLASGTSFAAAHVSGVAALVLAGAPQTRGKDLLAHIKATATDLGTPGEDEQFGAGCINAHQALVARTAGIGAGR